MKRILSILLMLAMLLSLAVTAFADTWTCPEWGGVNEKQFCGECGYQKKDTWTCPACGAENEKKFCEECGHTREEAAQEIKAGSYVTFGHYEQDNDLSNGKEAIEWLVLSVEGDTCTMIAVKGQDAVCFNKLSIDGNEWETSYIRTWLNETYYNEAFSAAEQAMITVGPTGDKVWLLSVDEANKYFADNDARVCYPSAYAKENGAFTDDNGAHLWWLRSPGSDSDFNAADVGSYGGVRSSGRGVVCRDEMARPVVVVSVAAAASAGLF